MSAALHELTSLTYVDAKLDFTHLMDVAYMQMAHRYVNSPTHTRTAMSFSHTHFHHIVCMCVCVSPERTSGRQW